LPKGLGAGTARPPAASGPNLGADVTTESSSVERLERSAAGGAIRGDGGGHSGSAAGFARDATPAALMAGSVLLLRGGSGGGGGSASETSSIASTSAIETEGLASATSGAAAGAAGAAGAPASVLPAEEPPSPPNNLERNPIPWRSGSARTVSPLDREALIEEPLVNQTVEWIGTLVAAAQSPNRPLLTCASPRAGRRLGVMRAPYEGNMLQAARPLPAPSRLHTRIVSTCSHLPACPGCPRFGARDPAPPAMGLLGELCREKGISLRVEVGARRGFRHRARLSVRGRVGAAKIGVFAAGSHRVVDIPNCEIHHPLINEVARALKGQMRKLGVESYSDGHSSGLVRGLQVVVERSSQRAQVVLICNSKSPDAAAPLLHGLSEQLGDKLHSLFWNGNTEPGNRILGEHFHQLSGPADVVETLGGARVHFPPGAFGQNNLDLFEKIVATIQGWVPPGAPLVELYAGCGSIGLGLLARAESVVFNEVSPDALLGLERGLSELGPALRARAKVIAGPASAAVQAIDARSAVVVDPPRKGLDPELTAALSERPPATLVYLSCGLDAFLRDTELLTRHGLRLSALQTFDLFPYTQHVETLALFERAPIDAI
jgi:23S rRNA (uracil1939-C5)-methyltransferase